MGDGAFHLLNPKTTNSPFPREKYVCVEPGHVRGYITLPIGGTWIGRQTLIHGS
jgi:hypothetical protein